MPQISLEQFTDKDDRTAGIVWWCHMTDPQRDEWLEIAETTQWATAWKTYKRLRDAVLFNPLQ